MDAVLLSPNDNLAYLCRGTLMSVEVALIGRNSKCKTSFLKAAHHPSDSPLPDFKLEAEGRWTPTFAPKQTDLLHTSAHGFAPSGERFLPVRVRHTSAADILEEDGHDDGDLAKSARSCSATLLVVPAEIIFKDGKLRGSRTSVNLVQAAVSRARERVGRERAQLAVAVSIDVEGDAMSTLDSSSTKAFLDTMKRALAIEGIPVVAVSPRTELWLREQQNEGGRVAYSQGDSQFRIPPAFKQFMDKGDIARARAAFEICDGTGIVASVSAAIDLNPPTLVFPVENFQTLQSSGWGGKGAPSARLRSCRLLRKTSNVRDLLDIEMMHGTLAGDLVSAEIVAASALSDATDALEPSPIDFDAPIGKGAWVVRLETNRKSLQVWNTGIPEASGSRKAAKPLASIRFGDLRSKERRRGKS